MNIWICNPYDPLPDEGLGELRYTRLSQALVAQGHVVTWWSADWSHGLKRQRSLKTGPEGGEPKPGARGEALDENQERGTSQPKTGKLKTSKLELKLLPVPSYQKNISLRRVWSHWCYARGIAKQAKGYATTHGKPDVILFSVPPMETGAVALKLGKQYGAKVVLDVMDAWPETLLLALPSAGSREQGAERKILASVLRFLSSVLLTPYTRMMRRYCRKVDAICAQSEAFADYARKYGATGDIPVFRLATQSPFHLRPLDTADQRGDGLDSPTFSPSHLQAFPQKRIFRILYLGSMGRVYDLVTLVDAVLQLLKNGVLVLMDLVGEGEQKAALEARVAAAGQESAIRFHGYLSGEALAGVLATADVGVIPMEPASKVAVPYKAADYLSCGLVLVNSLPGELEVMLDSYACGCSYTAGNIGSLVSALRHWLDDREALDRGKVGARQLFEAEFDATRIYPAMADWVVG